MSDTCETQIYGGQNESHGWVRVFADNFGSQAGRAPTA
jgi:hypothetical protein